MSFIEERSSTWLVRRLRKSDVRGTVVLEALSSTQAMHGDTTDEAARVLLERARAMTPAQRFEEGERLCRTARAFMRAGIRSRHPDYSSEQVEEALARLLWGDDLYRAAKPGRPLLEP